ncbi:MAG: sugar transferase [Gammaproteobacteria bacterium]|nr:sugar transferase [Gammaproteobacteria bacterium]
MRNYQRYGKPCFDLFVSLCAFIVLSPLFLLLILLVRLNLGSPVFFSQERGGKGGTRFKILKFRTMVDSYDKDKQLLPDEQRLTKFGKFLRNSSLDELPALLNVLQGQMSIVGPRPFVADYLEYYDAHQKQRHLVKPGITGWAQINGRNAITWDEKFEFDIWYVERQTFLLDLKIILLTFKRVFKQADISNEAHATMPSFIELSNKNEES